MSLEDEVKIYEQIIHDLRRGCDELSQSYTHAKTKTLTFIGGGLAFLSYLYGGRDLFIPEELYGIIFYFIGLILYIVAMSLLFLATRSVDWQIATDSKDSEDVEVKDYLIYLKKLRKEYAEVLRINIGHQNKKQAIINLAFPMLIAGAILLLIIKNF